MAYVTVRNGFEYRACPHHKVSAEQVRATFSHLRTYLVHAGWTRAQADAEVRLIRSMPGASDPAALATTKDYLFVNRAGLTRPLDRRARVAVLEYLKSAAQTAYSEYDYA